MTSAASSYSSYARGRGDRVDLRAERNLIVAVSARAADAADCTGGVCTSLGPAILPPAA